MSKSEKTPPIGGNYDRYKVGDLVYAAKRKLIYLLVNRDNSIPYRAGKGTLKGVVVWAADEKDSCGDPLPPVGYFHSNLGENHLEPYTGGVRISA